MKKFLLCFVVGCGILIMCLVATDNQSNALLRLHIRANSNLECDQIVKYEIKEEVVKYLTPFVSEAKSFSDAKDIIQQNLPQIKFIADRVLNKKGFEYRSQPKINNEYFPLRSYEGYTVESGYYDALIIELGEAKGDNWWCVVYPPLCFVNSNYINGDGVVYKSKILEIIEKVFK